MLICIFDFLFGNSYVCQFICANARLNLIWLCVFLPFFSFITYTQPKQPTNQPSNQHTSMYAYTYIHLLRTQKNGNDHTDLNRWCFWNDDAYRLTKAPILQWTTFMGISKVILHQKALTFQLKMFATYPNTIRNCAIKDRMASIKRHIKTLFKTIITGQSPLHALNHRYIHIYNRQIHIKPYQMKMKMKIKQTHTHRHTQNQKTRADKIQCAPTNAWLWMSITFGNTMGK